MEQRHYIPMDKKLKAEIVERAEKKFSKWFIDANTEISKTVNTAAVSIVEEIVEAPPLYGILYREAIERLDPNIKWRD